MGREHGGAGDGLGTAPTTLEPVTDPTGDHGVMLDVVMTGAGTLTLSPLVDGFTDDASDDVPYRVTNTSGSTSSVDVDLDYLRTE